jgi:hypothetical protein
MPVLPVRRPARAPRRQTPRRGARSCGTCPGWRRPGSAARRHRPGCSRSTRPVAACRCRGAAPARGCRRARQRWRASRPIRATARACGATGARQRAKSWPLPSPPRITTSLPAPCRRPGPAAPPRWRRRWCPCCRRRPRRRHGQRCHSTRCGSPRYSRRPCSMGASGQPMRRGQRQRGQRVGGVVAAADAQASAGIRRCRWIASSSLALALPQRRRRRFVGGQRAHQPGHAVLDHQAEVAGPLRRVQPEAQTRRGVHFTVALSRFALDHHRRRHHGLDERVVAVDTIVRLLAEHAALAAA